MPTISVDVTRFLWGFHDFHFLTIAGTYGATWNHEEWSRAIPQTIGQLELVYHPFLSSVRGMVASIWSPVSWILVVKHNIGGINSMDMNASIHNFPLSYDINVLPIT